MPIAFYKLPFEGAKEMLPVMQVYKLWYTVKNI